MQSAGKLKEKEGRELTTVTMLGAHGGRGENRATTSLQVTDSIVIDAGNILYPLGDKAKKIDHIFLTHCHLDHLIDIPFLIDAFFAERTTPLHIYGLASTLQSVKRHILNWEVWPDFNEIELLNRSEKSVLLHEIEFDKVYERDGIRLKPIKTNHTVESCGYVVEKEGKKIFFTSDTYKCDEVWKTVNEDPGIKTMITEVSFPSQMAKLAHDSKHLTPKLLEEELQKLKREDIQLYVSHLKPDFLDQIHREFRDSPVLQKVTILEDGSVIPLA